jgi:HD-GYP domain-containing protein (c-di-GMP phosphodiesterase class II)
MRSPHSPNRRILWGERFLRALQRLLQAVRIHQDNNQLISQSLSELTQAVAQLCVEGGDVELVVGRGRFYLQGERLMYRRENIHLVHEMLAFFEERNIQGLRFSRNMGKAPAQEILLLARILNQCLEQEEPASWLRGEMDGGLSGWVELLEEKAPTPPESVSTRQERAKRTYVSALGSLREVAQKLSVQGQAGVRKARRMVQEMVDLVLEDESVLMGLTTIKDHDDYTYVHSVNVAILSVNLGKRIGLSRVSLEQLGVCGLFHDLGKVRVAREILHKAEALTEGEWREIRKHPLSSVSQILRLRSSQEMKTRILLAPFEHHLKYDLSGYPKTHVKRDVSLFGRILAIVDVFDALTSARSYRSAALSPDYALSLMADGAGRDFDPILLKVFVGMMGVYPVGTLLQLDTGEMGLVADSSSGRDRSRPRVMLLVPDGRGGVAKGETVDLSEPDPRTGGFKRTAARSLNPGSHGIQPAHFLL